MCTISGRAGEVCLCSRVTLQHMLQTAWGETDSHAEEWPGGDLRVSPKGMPSVRCLSTSGLRREFYGRECAGQDRLLDTEELMK